MFRSTFRRLLAIDDPPERTALAFSIGIFIAFSPLLGLHTILATLLAFIFKFNKIAIYSGTFINNPFLTLVPIIVASYGVGAFIMGSLRSALLRNILVQSNQISRSAEQLRLVARPYHGVWPDLFRVPRFLSIPAE